MSHSQHNFYFNSYQFAFPQNYQSHYVDLHVDFVAHYSVVDPGGGAGALL